MMNLNMFGPPTPPIPPVPPSPDNAGAKIGIEEQGMLRLKKLIQEEDEFIVLQSGFILTK